MIPAPTASPVAGIDLVAGYHGYVARLACSPQAKRLRLLGLERFWVRFPDLEEWMTRPTAARLEDVRRADAWPFLTWCFAAGHVRPDVDLLAARSNGGHFTTWCRLHGDDVDRAVAVGQLLGWADSWIRQVCHATLALVCMTSGFALDGLTEEIFAKVIRDLDQAPTVSTNHRRVLHGRLQALRLVCFQLGVVDRPPPHANSRPNTIADHVAAIPQPDIRRVAIRYLQACTATLRPSTVEDRGDSLELFGIWLADHHPHITRLDQLDREVIEQFLAWNHNRPSRGRRAAGQPVSIARQHHAVSTLKTLFEDLALWGWAERPPRPLVHRSDLPRLPEHVPRALPPHVDRDLMAAVQLLADPAARSAIKILRGTGLRLGELLDLELDCLIDYASHGTWLRVPLGKLNSERTVPLDQATLDAFDDWARHRGHSRPLLHPRTRRPVEFLWVINGRRMGAGRIRRGLDLAASSAGIGHVHPHQLRHTYATALVNGGMSLEALMAVLGHVTPEMTLRYAHLASDTIRDAYNTAIAKTRTRTRLIAGPGGHFVPDRIEWLHAEMIKTRVAHGYCSRHLSAGPCPYSNICEQCDNYTTGHEFASALTDQLADVRHLRDDADQRGWTDDVQRHDKVITSLEHHLLTLELRPASTSQP
jgi:site-specific recombinase XerD